MLQEHNFLICQAVKEQWEVQSKKLRNLLSVIDNKNAHELHGIEKAFCRNPAVIEDNTLKCIDERTPGHIHLAGSGILLGLDKTLNILYNMEAEMVTSHFGCGAAQAAAKEHGLEPEDAEKFGIEFAQKLAGKAGLPFSHITKEMLYPPLDEHVARMAYYDGTGSFNYKKLEEYFVPGFTISRKYLDKDYAERVLRVSLSIAFGDHNGFSNYLTEYEKFVIAIIGNRSSNACSLEELKKEVREIVERHPERRKIDIVGFEAPIV